MSKELHKTVRLIQNFEKTTQHRKSYDKRRSVWGINFKSEEAVSPQNLTKCCKYTRPSETHSFTLTLKGKPYKSQFGQHLRSCLAIAWHFEGGALLREVLLQLEDGGAGESCWHGGRLNASFWLTTKLKPRENVVFAALLFDNFDSSTTAFHWVWLPWQADVCPACFKRRFHLCKSCCSDTPRLYIMWVALAGRSFSWSPTTWVALWCHHHLTINEGEVVYFNAGFIGQAKMLLRQCLLWRPGNTQWKQC